MSGSRRERLKTKRFWARKRQSRITDRLHYAAMRLINHSSELIHQIYQRAKIEDVVQWRNVV